MNLISVMYHFVENLDRVSFPGLKGLTAAQFRGQLDYLLRHHTPVGTGELLRAVRGEGTLPDNGFVLTFDHGTRDHLEIALPELCRRGLDAFFFVMTATPELGTVPAIDKQRLLEGRFAEYDRFLDRFSAVSARCFPDRRDRLAPTEANLASAADYLPHLPFYSTPERFFRRLRNELLSTDEFAAVIDELFAEEFNDKREVARTWYLDWDECRALVDAGMTVGSHGHHHLIYAADIRRRYQDDVRISFDLLRERLGGRCINAFSYPNGAYEDGLAELLEEVGATLAFTTRVGVEFEPDRWFAVDRLDTTELPFSAAVKPCRWSRQLL